MEKKNQSNIGKKDTIKVLVPDRQISPVVFASPHSGIEYPADFVTNSPLDLLALRKSEDAFVDVIFSEAPNYGMPLISALFPRAFVDPNREPFELDPGMFEETLPDYVNTQSSRVHAGLGTIARVVSSGQKIYSKKLKFKDVAERIDTNYRPYHRQLRRLLDDTRQTYGCYLLIDCHSMPSIGGPHDPDAGKRRPDIVLGNCFSTSCNEKVISIIEKVFLELGYDVARNKPFAGGFSTRHYGDPHQGCHAIQIEINRELYMDERTIKKNKGMDKMTKDINTVIGTLALIKRNDLLV